MIISKMAVKTQIGELDEDAKELEYIHRDKVIGIIIAKVPKKYKEMTKTALEEHIDRRWTIRNTRLMGEISPKTGKQYRLTHPAPILGYSTEAEADKRVGEANKAGEISRAKAAAKRRKTVKQELAEIDEDFADKIAEEAVATTTDSNLKQVLDKFVLTYSDEYSNRTDSQKKRMLSRDLQGMIDLLEDGENYTQSDISAFQQMMQKLKGKKWLTLEHNTLLQEIARKLLYDDSKNASWQDSIKKSKIQEAIKNISMKYLDDEDDLPMEFNKSEDWQSVIKKKLTFNSISEIHGHIDEMEDMLYDLMMADRYVLYMEDLSKDLNYIRQEKDLQAATEMFNGLQNEINRLYDDYNKSTGMQYDI